MSNKLKIDAAEIIVKAAQLPLVHVERRKFLESNFKEHCSDEMLREVLESGPFRAGVSRAMITKVADHAINQEVIAATALSAAAGLPGGPVAIATTIADLTQFNAAIVRTAQKLAYVYGWPQLFEDPEEEPSEATKNALILFVGVMYGVSAANKGVGNVVVVLEKGVAQNLINSPLTKGTIYPIVKKVAKLMSVKMTKGLFARGAAKLVPIAGAVFSAGLTVATFIPMAKRLQKELETRQNNILKTEKRPKGKTRRPR